jgi:5'-3' exonuclease
MTNLIFDLNNIVHRSMFVVGGYGSKKFTFDSQSEIDQLMRKIAMDTTFIIRLINPSRILFALDDKSWRKDIKIDENEGYKANRTKSSYINWNNVYTALSEFSDLMKSNGFIVTKIENAEADDVVALWSHELMNSQSQHVIIVSGDEDLRQLVNYKTLPFNNKIIFTTVFNPFMQRKNASRKLYVPQHFQDWITATEAIDIFNMKGSINIDKEDFRKIITAEKTKMEVIDGRMIVLRKMFCGDDGDNIPAIYSWLNEKGVEIRITNSKFEKIYEMLQQNPEESLTYLDIIKRIEKVLEAIKKVTKQNISDNFDMWTRLDRQMKLVVLDKELFPEKIVKTFEGIKENELSKPRVNYANLNMHNLLEGTRYVRERKNENEAPIFKQIDRIKGNALF